ncbi:MAG: protein tyrosine phosphatase [Actinomycetales bacterium]
MPEPFSRSAASTWPEAANVLTLPGGRRVRGVRIGQVASLYPRPDMGVYAPDGLLRRATLSVPWERTVLRWRDFGYPADPDTALSALAQAWHRAATERVEVGCRGGRGRTGTMLACLGVFGGLTPAEAVLWVRAGYHRRAVETPAQRRFIRAADAYRDW